MKNSTPLFRSLGLAAILSTAIAGAQPIVDITMADNGTGQLEVRIRPDGTFSGIVSNITFTIRWPESGGIALDTANALFPAADYMYPAASPVVSGFNGYLYRTYNVVSLIFMDEVGITWEAGREYPLCTIDILNPGLEFTLGNDAWTAVNNRNYFCSLNGLERTGGIFPSVAPTTQVRSAISGGALDILLTPDQDFFGWASSLDLTVSWPAEAGAHLGEVVQHPSVASYLPMAKNGPEVVYGGRVYQRFHGEGTMSIANAGEAWWAGQDVRVLTVQLLDIGGDISVVNDAWTADNNGDFAIVLNGTPSSGSVEATSATAAAVPAADLSITAFQQQGRLCVQGSLPDALPVELDLYTIAGQHLHRDGHRPAGRRFERTIDVSTLPEGVYLLQARAGQRSTTLRLVL